MWREPFTHNKMKGVALRFECAVCGYRDIMGNDIELFSSVFWSERQPVPNSIAHNNKWYARYQYETATTIKQTRCKHLSSWEVLNLTGITLSFPYHSILTHTKKCTNGTKFRQTWQLFTAIHPFNFCFVVKRRWPSWKHTLDVDHLQQIHEF